jgi:hypothetical protein
MGTDNHARWRFAWKVAAYALTLFSVAWVIWLLAETWPVLAAHRNEIQWVLLLSGLALSLGASFLAFEAFVALVRIVGISGLGRRELAHLHFTGQLLKHLPGRIWGFGYQSAAGSSGGSIGDWLGVNFGHMVLATFFALWSACLALGFSRGMAAALFVMSVGGLAYVLGWKMISSAFVIRTLERLPGKFGKLGQRIRHLVERTSPTARFWIFVIFSLSSLLYYGSWVLYGASYPPLGMNGGMRLCAYYLLAWFVGYVSLITPSGIGVRELVFAWLANDFPGDAVAMAAIVGRVSLLVVDLLLGLAFSPFMPRNTSR